MEPSTSIIEWYQNQIIFLTGGSGYIGKGLIYKLLKCGAPKIFVLIRTKRGQNPEERLDAVANHWIYDPLRAQEIDIRSKLVAIAGDVTVPQLGISEKDRQTLHEEVTVVLHTAASIKFDDPLKIAVFYNLRSAREMVELAKGMKKLKIFQHVSTAFCNIDQMVYSSPIVEKVYPAKMDWRKLIEFVETNDDELISVVEAKVLDTHVNTYLFTKHLAENVIEDAAHIIPVTISRPPIVMGSWKEPEPGWVDNNASAIMLMAAGGKGILRVNLNDETKEKAYAPLDTSVNMILVSSWHEAIVKKGNPDGHVSVFNQEYCPRTPKDLIENGMKILKKVPMHKALWVTSYHCTTNESLFLIYHLIEHLIPGLFFDILLRLTGNKPRLIKIYRKIYIAMVNLFPIVSLSDKFDTSNYDYLKEQMPKNERKVFELDVPYYDEAIFSDYLYKGMVGIRKFFGEPPEPTEEDFIHQKRLYWLDIGFKGLLILLFFWLVPLSLLAAPFFYISGLVMNFLDSV